MNSSVLTFFGPPHIILNKPRLRDNSPTRNDDHGQKCCEPRGIHFSPSAKRWLCLRGLFRKKSWQKVFFRCVLASVYEGLSVYLPVRPSATPSVCSLAFKRNRRERRFRPAKGIVLPARVVSKRLLIISNKKS